MPPIRLSKEVKQLMRMKKPEFVSYMSTNSTKKELAFLYKLLYYRNIENDDTEEMIVNTFTKDELSESIYRIMHRRSFWNVATVINCVSMLIKTWLWIHSFSKIRQAYKTGSKPKLSFLDGASFVLHSLFVINNLNLLQSRRTAVRRQKKANQLYLDYHLQNTQKMSAPVSANTAKKPTKRKPSPTKRKLSPTKRKPSPTKKKRNTGTKSKPKQKTKR